MILGAGLGTRLRPLSGLRPKPALPVRGLPVLAYSLALLARYGVREVAINLHHLPDQVRDAAERHRPEGMALHFSHEPELLGTGGGIRRLASFLGESEPSLVLAGDMILDADLERLLAFHREREDWVTLLLRADPRAANFGTIGIDSGGCVRRIASRFDLGGESSCGVYAHATVVRSEALDGLPTRRVFGHLDDWLMPRLASGATDVGALLLDTSECLWEPVGTPAEYLAANLRPHALSYLNADARARAAGVRIEDDLVVGAGARLGRDVRLTRAVVWDGEIVPDGFQGSDGVFAGGRFHDCEPAEASAGEGNA
jgi:NDP-sugar pyrophosphorylase family protein